MATVPKSDSVDRPYRSIALTSVERWQAGAVTHVQDYLAVEEPLEIRIGDMPMSVTMRPCLTSSETSWSAVMTP